MPLLCLLPATTPARADQLLLGPPATDVAIRAYGLGLLPFDGKFTRFHGVMRYDPKQPQKCQVMLEIDATSLQMSSQSVTDRVIGPDFLDTAQYAVMAFSGTCQGDGVAGMLTLRGQTHPFDLDLHQDNQRLTATGRLLRADWGMTADRLTVGRTIRIQVDMPAPSVTATPGLAPAAGEHT
jgi:polyisoprenoid-binding protein YceI